MSKQRVLRSLLALYALAWVGWLSLHFLHASHNLLVLDEFFALNLLADPSWRHVVDSWNHGADSGGLLYYAVLWPLTHGSAHAIAVARTFSILCYLAAGFVWWRVLSRFLRPSSAGLGIAMVCVSSSVFLVYVARIRFYMPLVFFSALATFATLRASDEDTSENRAAVMVFAAHAVLVLIHMLGALYSGLLLVATSLCLLPRRRAVWIAMATLAAWSPLLLCRTAIHSGSLNATSQTVPLLRDLVRFVTRTSATPFVVLFAALGVCWLLASLLPRAGLTAERATISFRGPVLACAFLCAPICMYVFSQFWRPLAEARYFLPFDLALCTGCAVLIDRLRSWQQGRFATLTVVGCLLLLIPGHLTALRFLPPPPALDLGNLPSQAAGRPVVVADEQTFFELQYYRSTPQLQFKYLLPPTALHASGMMLSVARQGYFANSFGALDTFERSQPDFFYLPGVHSNPFSWITYGVDCTVGLSGSMEVDHTPAPLIHVRGCDTPGQQQRLAPSIHGPSHPPLPAPNKEPLPKQGLFHGANDPT